MRFRKYPVKTDFFDKWCADSAYILGFILTDGNIFENRLGFELQARDQSILEFIRERISPSSKIKLIIRNNREYAIFRINSKELVEKLKNAFGVTQRKSLTLDIPFDIPTEYLYDFIRGIFDGDGSVRSSKTLESQICSGSLIFLEKLKGLSGLGKIIKSGNLYRLLFNKEESLMLSKLMYNSQGFFLKRKREIFDAYQNSNKKHWTLEQIDYLKTNYIPQDGNSVKNISNQINKSIGAIRQKIWQLGLVNI